MKLDKLVEDRLISIIKKAFIDDFWTYKHTIAAVKAIKQIAGAENANERILVTAMYLHDMGYSGKLGDGYTLSDRIESKTSHMALGAKKAAEVLPELGYSEQEVEQITHLISIHDALDELKTKEEIMVMEADSLGQIDPNLPPGFEEADFKKYVNYFDANRAPKFTTNMGKQILKRFAKENERFWKYTTLFKQKK